MQKRDIEPPQKWIWLALLALAGLAVYANSFSGPFVFDDRHAIEDNVSIRRLSRIVDVISLHQNQGHHTGGRPLLNLSFAINYALGGLSVAGYHAANLAIHLVNGLLLFGIVHRTLAQPILAYRSVDRIYFAFAVALLWLVHPLQTGAVTFIAQRGELLSATFYLLAVHGFIRGTELGAESSPWLFLTVVACLVGSGVKETLVTAPVMIFLYDRTFVAGTFRKAWNSRAPLYAALSTTWVLLFYFVSQSASARVGADIEGYGANWTHYVLTEAKAVVHYLQLGVYPSPLIFDYGTALVDSVRRIPVEAFILISLLAGTVYALFCYPVLGFLGAWFFAILAPSSSFVPLYAQPIAEHRMYLSLAAEIAILVIGCQAALRHLPKAVLLVAAGLVLGGLTLERNYDYRSAVALFSDTVAKSPFNSRAHLSLGGALFEAGQSEAALASLRRAIELDPKGPRAHALLARVFISLGRSQEALAHASRAVALAPANGAMHYTLGNILRRTGDLARSVAECELAVTLLPNDPVVHAELGTALLQSGQTSAAVLQYRRALEIDPDLEEVHTNLGMALLASNRLSEAVAQFTRVLQTTPDDADAEYLLGSALSKLDRKEEAQVHFIAAVNLNPKHTDALQALKQLRSQGMAH